MTSNPSTPELIPGLEDFWAPDQSLEAVEREVENKPPKFAPGRQAKYEYGFVYRGPWETLADGVCKAVRGNACALRRSGIPVFLQSPMHMHWNKGIVERCSHWELPRQVLDQVDHLCTPDHARTIGWIEHFVPTFAKLVALTEPQNMGPDANLKPAFLRSSAAFMALEHDVIPPQWLDRLHMFGRVIVPCEANARWLRDAGIQIPVHVVVHPLDVKDPIRRAKAKPYEGGTFRFFHMGKWEPRKNQHYAIGGFLRAFKPDDPVHFLIKASAFWNAPGYPSVPEESVAQWLCHPDVKANGWDEGKLRSRLRVSWNEKWSREDIAETYAASHCYVQSGRSEGFDLPCLDAKVAGLRVVAVGFGGPEHFLTSDDIRVQYKRSLAPPAKYFCPTGTLWPAPGSGEYGEAMRQAFDRRFEPAGTFDVRPYLVDSVGAQLRAIAIEMGDQVGVDLREYKK